jgi:DNA polymerase III alpha subunit
MIKNKFGEQIYNKKDIMHVLMQGYDLPPMIVANDVHVDSTMLDTTAPQFFMESDQRYTVEQFDQINQSRWFMPEEYINLDIAEYLLNLCKTDAELQRVGQELLLYNERNLFDLLRYLKYLVDTMEQNGIIWGVGRGSSVASYVLYLLGVHKIDSIYYDLDPEEFLR